MSPFSASALSRNTALLLATTFLVSCGDAPTRSSDSAALSRFTAQVDPDLSIAVTGPSSTPSAVRTTFDITLTNPTSVTATGVEVVIDVPSGITIFSGGSDGPGTSLVPPNCNQDFLRDEFVCDVGALAPGTTTFTRGARGTDVGSWTVTATVASDLVDPDPSNNTASHTTEVTPGPDLAVSVTADRAQAGVGETVVFEIEVENVGGAPTSGSSVSGEVNAATWEFMSVTTTAGTCTFSDPPTTLRHRYTCDLGAVAAGDAVTVLLTLGPGSLSRAGHRTIGAEVFSSGGDADGSNDEAGASVLLHPVDVSVAVSGPATALTGETFTHTVTFANAGPSELDDSEFEIEVSGATVVSATPSGGSCNPPRARMLCFFGLAAGESVTVPVEVSTGVAGTVTVSGEFREFDNSDTDPSNDQASASTTVSLDPNAPTPDLSIAITGPASTPEDVVTAFDITLTNPTSVTVTGVEVVIDVPSGISIFSGGSQGPGTSLIPPVCSEDFLRNEFVCAVGALAPGTTTFTRGARGTDLGTWTVTATVTSDLVDPDPSNNTASHTTEVTLGPDLAVSVTADKAQAGVGETVVFEILVGNVGGAPTSGSTVSGDISTLNWEFVSITTTAGTCSFTDVTNTYGDRYHCDLGSLAAGDAITVLLTLGPGSLSRAGNRTIGARVFSSGGDADASNDEAGATVLLHPVDVSVAVSGPATALTGETFTHTVTFANAGPSDLDDSDFEVRVSGATVLSATPSAGGCNTPDERFQCTIAIAAGGSVTIPVELSTGLAGNVTVTGEFREFDNSDTDPSNDEASATTTVRRPEPIVTLSGPRTRTEGSTGTYSFTVDAVGGTFTVAASSCGSAGTLVGGSLTTTPTGGSFECEFPDGPATTTVTLSVNDAGGLMGSASVDVTVNNAAPTATFAADPSVNEGTPFQLALTGGADPSPTDLAAGLEYAFDCGDGAGFGAFGPTPSATCATTDDAARTARGSVRDKDGGVTTYTQAVTVQNVAPVVSLTRPIPVELLRAGNYVGLEGQFTDPGADTHSAVWRLESDFASIEVPEEIVPQPGGGLVSTWVRVDTPGRYHVTLEVHDDDGGVGSASAVNGVQTLVVVFDPAAGSVTGEGRFDSPAGGYLPEPGFAGRARLSMRVRYPEERAVPDGRVTVSFEDRDLDLRSTGLDWLVIPPGRSEAVVGGTGVFVGRDTEYRFMVWLDDLDFDEIRVRVWQEQAGGMQDVIYDNGMPQRLVDGDFRIHR